MGGMIYFILYNYISKYVNIIGSYGGYMAGILAARHPERFKCGILLNPVVNIPFNVNITGKK